MTRNDIFRRRLGRQINVRPDHDVGRCVGIIITKQQNVARLRCKDAVDKTVVLFHLSRMRLENTSLSSTHVRDTVNRRPCRLQHADAPITSIRLLSLMAWRNTILEQNQTQGRVVAIKRGFHPPLQLTWNTNARVLRANFEIHANFVLSGHLVRSKIDDTRFRAASKQQKLATLLAHPDLAGKLAATKHLTKHSTDEQASAGLDALTADENKTFTDLNDRYRKKFGFPFIIAVKGLKKSDIIAAFKTRLNHDRNSEFAAACQQVEKIALLRLQDMV